MEIISFENNDVALSEKEKILDFGLDAQQKMADFSAMALEKVKNRDLGEIGDMISTLAAEIKPEEKGFLSKFKRPTNKIQAIRNSFEKTEKTVDKITEQLENKLFMLHKDIALLEQMYQINQQNYQELERYISQGKSRADEIKKVVIPDLRAKAEESPSPQSIQSLRDGEELLSRLEKRIFDLELSRTVSAQTAPQIRLIQRNDSVMAEKIRSALNNTIPLWKGQMIIALGIEHSLSCERAYREICDVTNSLILKNAENLKTATLDTEKSWQRGTVDVETLEKVNGILLDGLKELETLQQEGRQKRQEASDTLHRLEKELLSIK